MKEEYRIGIIGFGFVGRAALHGLEQHYPIMSWDKYSDHTNSLEDTVNKSNIIFICVPTPVDNMGIQDLSQLEDAISSVDKVAENKKEIVIKSTVLPGTTRKFQEVFRNHYFTFNPEFLTERTADIDFITPTRIILGTRDPNIFKAGIPCPIYNMYYKRFGNVCPYHVCTFEEAEMIKYVSNCYFAMKISFCNEIHELCKKLNISYDNVKSGWLSDGRITKSHVEVPGPDGKMGYGGKCFPKDLKSFINFGKSIGLEMDLFEATDKVNDRVRPGNDWMNIKGTSTDNSYEN